MNSRKALLIVLLMYAISILFRLPNLNRPLSKHHEFVAATVLIAAEAWQERGGGAQYAFVPFINYAKPGDYIRDKDVSFDEHGNGIYLSYGPGMYVIPYLIFKIFNVNAEPLYLQCINLAFLLLSVVMLYRLLALVFTDMKRRYELVILGCFLFLFNPCILWFLGNGYVNVTISIPFLIGAIYQALIVLYTKKDKYLPNYIWLSFFIIAGIYIDWNAFFAALVIAIFAVVKSKFKKMPTLSWVAGLSAALGVALIVKQFSLYLSLDQIVYYWKSRFFTRSIESTGIDLPHKLLNLFSNVVSGYLPVLLLSLILFFRANKKNVLQGPALPKAFLFMSGITCILYNFTFFNWSYIHDFSMVPISIFFVFIPLYLISLEKENRKIYLLLACYFLLTIAQYYYINRPGKLSQNGSPYALFKTFGEKLQTVVAPDEMIFMSEASPMTSFYSKRYIFQATDSANAKQKLREWHYPKGVWIEQNDNVFISAQKIKQ